MGAVRKLIGEGASDTEIEATISARGHSESLDILGDLFGRKEAIRFFLGADHEEISRILGFIEGNFKGLSREASAAVDTLTDKTDKMKESVRIVCRGGWQPSSRRQSDRPVDYVADLAQGNG